MDNQTGTESPERPLMRDISDLLGIEHFTTARGSTVRRDFLAAVAEALGVDSSTGDKDELLDRVASAATGEPAPPWLRSVGGTVTNRALSLILEGLRTRGQVDEAIPHQIVLEMPAEAHELLTTTDAELQGFDPSEVNDERRRRLALVATRQGQDAFRAALLSAYDGRCAVTGFDAVEGLEAAHIFPYRGAATHHLSNGLCLRADLHTLFDRGLLGVDEVTLRVLLKPELLITRYRSLADVDLQLPRRSQDRPSRAALRFHRQWADL